ncbi:MAG: beta-lactamase family protein [Anaerolineae bacterium]|nr:beta-lactamase family protein [Anaerolineae bacterium]
MRIRYILSGSLLGCAALMLVRRAGAGVTSTTTVPNSSSYAAIDAFIEAEMQRLKIPGISLAVVADQQVAHLRGFGEARPGGETPTPQMPFFIGSVTKSFTALAVMQLVEAGKAELDAPVQHYLPWFRVADPEASAQMTVRHLLNQTSGIPVLPGELALGDIDNRPGAAERQARALSKLVLPRPVGAAYEYSNANYILLGLIIEATSGESYQDYIQNHIFTPLEMKHSYTSQAAAQQDGPAVGHQYWFTLPVAAPDMPIPLGAMAGGMLISCAEDMAHYMIALLNEGRYGDARIISSASIAELHHGVAEVSTAGMSMGHYGMGWFIDTLGQTKVAWHSGTLPHFGAHIALLPEQKKGVILLFNACHHWMNPVLAQLGDGVTARLAGEQPTPVPIASIILLMLRGQLLIPALQIVGVIATLRRLRRWHATSEQRPGDGRAWGQHILLPLIFNLLLARTLIKPVRGERRGYLKYYMPDFSWLATVCGSFALAWSALRTVLVARALRKS